jgi:hypothetical protein
VTWPGPQVSADTAAGELASRWHDRRGLARWWWLGAIVLLLAAAVVLGLAFRAHQRSLPGPLYPGGSVAGAAKANPVARSLPVALSIPAIDVKVALSQLGLNPDGTVQVPTDFQEPGWYRFGASPGQLGSAVILGHVDSYQGPAVFFRLRTLRPGDQVEVALADGVTTHFVVRQVAMYSKSQFPTRLVYASHGYSGLQLVTCGGVFDSQTGHYLSNIVVYTSLVSSS